VTEQDARVVAANRLCPPCLNIGYDAELASAGECGRCGWSTACLMPVEPPPKSEQIDLLTEEA